MSSATLKACRLMPRLLSIVGSMSDYRSKDHKFEFQLGHMTSKEIEYKIISSYSSGRAVLSYWQKYVHKVLVHIEY